MGLASVQTWPRLTSKRPTDSANSQRRQASPRRAVGRTSLHRCCTTVLSQKRAPLIFTALADDLEWILKQRGVSYIAHYLDDFITAPNSDQCLQNRTILFETCKELGLLLAPHKSVGPTTCLIFLGLEIDFDYDKTNSTCTQKAPF